MEKSIVGRETGKTRLSALHSLLRGIFPLNCLEVFFATIVGLYYLYQDKHQNNYGV